MHDECPRAHRAFAHRRANLLCASLLLHRFTFRRVAARRVVEQCKGVFDRRDYLNKMRHTASAVVVSDLRERPVESFLRTSLKGSDPLPCLGEGGNNLAGGTSVSLTKRATDSAPRVRRLSLRAEPCRTRGFSLLLGEESRGDS